MKKHLSDIQHKSKGRANHDARISLARQDEELTKPEIDVSGFMTIRSLQIGGTFHARFGLSFPISYHGQFSRKCNRENFEKILHI
ncbi:MAG: hypothetical protein GY821_08320 [Gammaproteobacteria bacterium]|nr:hypothetical protein [Gammaproteobacteria bacterium]